MSITSRIDRIFGRPPPTPAQLPPPANVPVLLPESPASAHQQWYERDAELLNREKESLEAKGFQAECTILPNAKVCFTTTLAGTRAAIICGYLHPLEPVTVQLLDEVAVPSVVDDMGKVDLFSHEGFTWSADLRLGDVAQRVATLLSVAGATATASKPPTGSTKAEETLPSATGEGPTGAPTHPSVAPTATVECRRLRPK